MSYDLTPERLEEIERAARAVQERHTPGSEWRVVAFQDPETVLALCRMARRALELEAQLAAIERTDARARERTATERARRSLGD